MIGIKRVRDALFRSSGDQFAYAATTILSGFLENTGSSRRLGRLDRAGIDAYAYSAGADTLLLSIQYKGFELFEYGSDQHKQCCDEIIKYAAKGPQTPEYWLAINRPVKDRKMREELNGLLDSLIESGKAKRAILLDLEALLDKLKDLAASRLSEWSQDRRSELFTYYESRMQFVDYIAEVPFHADADNSNPTEHVARLMRDFYEKIPMHQTGRHRPAPRFLITSGFGFGKTSTLHAFAKLWIQRGGHIIYAPAPLLNEAAFTNTAGLAAGLLQLLTPDDTELDRLVLGLLQDALRFSLATSKGWILLIDGIDESPWALSPNGLAALWGSMRDLGVAAILSARDELVRSRPMEFEHKAQSGMPAFLPLKLTDWSDDLILRFLREFADRHDTPPPPGFHLLRELVERGQYAAVYGDIPKRPLFLGMLAEDAWAGRDPSRELHRLYGEYFRRKLALDQISNSAGGVARRPSAILATFGREEAAERLIGLMEAVAAAMTSRTRASADRDGNAVLTIRDTIEEDRLREIAKRRGVEFRYLEDLLMHSLLQPGARDRVTHRRTIRFAHRSYQEWFLARHFAQVNLEPGTMLPEGVLRFLTPMATDLARGEALP